MQRPGYNSGRAKSRQMACRGGSIDVDAGWVGGGTGTAERREKNPRTRRTTLSSPRTEAGRWAVSAWDLTALPTDKAAGCIPKPVVSAARRLRRSLPLLRPASAEALHDRGAETEEQCQQAGIEPSEIHRDTSAPSFGLLRPCCRHAIRRKSWGNTHARPPIASPRRFTEMSQPRNGCEVKVSFQEKSSVGSVSGSNRCKRCRSE